MFDEFDVDPIRLGYIVKKVRNKKKKGQRDLEDENISRTTISRIENGEILSKEKFFYLLSKLHITKKQLRAFIKAEHESEEKVRLILLALDDVIDQLEIEQAQEFLLESDIENTIDKHHPYLPYLSYLKGKILYYSKKHDKAKKMYEESIQQSKLNPSFQFLNITSSANNELGYIEYLQNNVDLALDYTNKGLEEFKSGGERSFVKHVLLVNKVIYLQKIGKLKITDNLFINLWRNKNLIEKVPSKVQLYMVYAAMLLEEEKYIKALDCIHEGINLARINRLKLHSFSLWSMLATTYLKLNKVERAEKCFNSAIKLGENLPNKVIFIETYSQRGTLYTKMKKWDLAQENILTSIKLAEKHDAQLKLIDALVSYGEYYIAQDNFNEAIIQMERANNIATDRALLSKVIPILTQLAECYQKTNNEKQFLNCMQKKRELEETIRNE